jgi:putative membrane protein
MQAQNYYSLIYLIHIRNLLLFYLATHTTSFMKTHLSLITLAAFLAVAAPAYAHEDRMTLTGPEFAQQAAIANNYEIWTSKVALQRSHDPAVRSLAKEMIADHTAAGKKLAAILASDGTHDVRLNVLDDTHEKAFNDLKATNANSFNYQYVADQAAAHEEAIHLFQTYATNGDDAGLRNFAEKTLPTLRHHQEMVQRVSMKPGYSWH